MLIPIGILAASKAGAAGAYDLLETVSLASSASSVTFSGLDAYSDYKHLQIRAVMRSTKADNNRTLVRMTFNSDTGANYAYHQLRGNGSSVTSSSGTSANFMQILYAVPDNDSGLLNNFGVAVVDILDYANSSKNTTVRGLGGNNCRFDQQDISLDSGLWNSTSAVTSTTLVVANGFSFITGSRFSLYGIKGD